MHHPDSSEATWVMIKIKPHEKLLHKTNFEKQMTFGSSAKQMFPSGISHALTEAWRELE